MSDVPMLHDYEPWPAKGKAVSDDELPIVKRLRDSFTQTPKEAADLITELVAALEPFSQALDGDAYEGINGDIWESGAAAYLDFDNLRRARDVLEKAKK